MTAQGTVVLAGPHGDETGTITVAAWGADHCKITIALGPAILHRQVTAVMNGKSVSITGPAGMLASAPLPVSPKLGCALLPEGLTYDHLAAGGVATLSLDPASRLPSSLTWTDRRGPAVLSYAGYQPGALPLAAQVTETVSGSVRLRIQFTSIASQTFTDADFALPTLPKPAKATQAAGGLQ